jgi:uncharacterized protein YwqG
MNEDMPWVNLTQEEVEELRKQKHELTEYGKQKLRELMTHEEMLEEAVRREKENQVLEIAKKFIEEHSDAMKQLAKIEHQELAAELALELRSWAQNEEMIDQYFTKHGIICNQAADLLELLANETVD